MGNGILTNVFCTFGSTVFCYKVLHYFGSDRFIDSILGNVHDKVPQSLRVCDLGVPVGYVERMALLFEYLRQLTLRESECRTGFAECASFPRKGNDGLFLLLGNFVHSEAVFHVGVWSGNF
jgi:hypothetical protein